MNLHVLPDFNFKSRFIHMDGDVDHVLCKKVSGNFCVLPPKKEFKWLIFHMKSGKFVAEISSEREALALLRLLLADEQTRVSKGQKSPWDFDKKEDLSNGSWLHLKAIRDYCKDHII